MIITIITVTSKTMPRVCNRAGCGKPLLKRDGTPDYRRQFCSDDCSRADRREKMQVLRASLKPYVRPHFSQRCLQDTLV